MIDKEFLYNYTILYVEDEVDTQVEILKLINPFFKKIHVANDGAEALKIIEKYKDISVIISDINMPKISGIDMVKVLFENNVNIPFIFTTAHSESKYLLDAIKYNTSGYILKPFDIKDLLLKIQNVLKEIHNSKLVKIQKKELSQYIDVIDKVAIISRANLKGEITYVNERFCETSKYTKDELLGKQHNIIRHPDMSSDVFKEMWQTIKSGNIWEGKIKNKDKEGKPYYVHSTIIPRLNSENKVVEYIGIRFLITKEEMRRRKFKKDIMQNIQQSRISEYRLKKELENKNESIKKIEEMLVYRNDELKKQKIKNSKQYAQIRYYEDELKKIKTEFDVYRKAHYSKLRNSIFERNEFKKENIELIKRNEKLEEQICSRSSEFNRLNNRVAEQSKIISDLRDVIDYNETQIRELKSPSQ